MSNKPSSKVEKAIAFIAERGRVRTTEIGDHLGVHYKNVTATLAPAVDRGYLITCRVDRPGLSPVVEYSIAASINPATQPWREYLRTHRAEHKSGRRQLAVTARPMRKTDADQVPSKAESRIEPTKVDTRARSNMGAPGVKRASSTARNETRPPATPATVKEGPVVQVAVAEQAPLAGPTEPRTASKKISANLYISLDNNSRLHISTGDDYIDLDPAAVRELGQFMADTEPAWA